MKYRIKNDAIVDQIKRMLEGWNAWTFGQFMDEFQKNCELNFEDEWSDIQINLSSTVYIYCSIEFEIPKSEIEVVPEYKANGWNKFPDVKPPEVAHYLVMNDKGERAVLEWQRFDDICADHTVHWWDVKFQWSDPEFEVTKFHAIPDDEE